MTVIWPMSAAGTMFGQLLRATAEAGEVLARPSAPVMALDQAEGLLIGHSR